MRNMTFLPPPPPHNWAQKATAILSAVSLAGCLTSQSSEIRNFPYVDLGSSRDGISTYIPELERVLEKKQTTGMVLVYVEGCEACMATRVENIPIRDKFGRTVVLMTSDNHTYQKYFKLRQVLYDRKRIYAKKFSVRVAPRQYLVNLDCKVKVAETGDREIDGENGFEKL